MWFVQGNSPAGGCVVAMSCDYRVMASGKYRIGLNETHLVGCKWFLILNTRPTLKRLNLQLLDFLQTI